ncbi:MAG: GNAT family N-acetyltransferase [Bacteroidales bacterium]|nr:GNAT family N-acetyltransferase [Bacteroidales bacterium]
MKDILIKELNTFEQFKDCYHLQDKIWNLSDKDKISAITLKALTMRYPQMGIVIGAFIEKMIGFAVFFPTQEVNTLYGHIIGVLKEYADANIGVKMLMKAQEICSEREIIKICWTYEPLEGRNANLYINKMGAIAVKYEEEYFEVEDELNRGFPIDRFIVDWNIQSKRVVDRINKKTEKKSLSDIIKLYKTVTNHYFPNDKTVLVEIPSDLQKIKKENMTKAIEYRMNTRKIFNEYLNNRGFIISELYSEIINNERRNYYLLEKRN